MDNSKLSVVERIKSANNVLIAVSRNPSIDQLSAAIGLALFLNKLNKHATAVFSGEVPSAIEFLEPEKTIEKTTDSLRDFIIALDKSKADKLRYKVEDEFVKIYITPYRTSIKEDDLEFSQGDFNVDVIVALGVGDQNDLDDAITSHGRILHDATVVTLSLQPIQDLGSINWVQESASSLCEMVGDITDSINENGLDQQIATALLTGIVAETERFSNNRTTATTMSVSAKLLAAGANQQLVAENLAPKPEPAPVLPPPPAPEPPAPAEPGPMQEPPVNPAAAFDQPEPDEAEAEDALTLPPVQPEPVAPAEPPKAEDGALYISHDIQSLGDLAYLDDEPEQKSLEQIHIDDQGLLRPADQVPPAAAEASRSMVSEPPSHGGTLTASAQDESLGASTDPLSGASPQQQNGPILTHGAPGQASDALSPPTPFNPMDFIPTEPRQPFSGAPAQPSTPPVVQPLPVDTETVPKEESLLDLEAAVADRPVVAPIVSPPTPDLDAAREAVNSVASASVGPRQDLNAMPSDLGLPGDHPVVDEPPISVPSEPQINTGVSAAPPVPPPLMPPTVNPYGPNPQNPTGI